MALTPGTRLGVFELISAAAAFFDTKANKLRAMGWRPDYGKLTGDTIAAAATYCTLGLLLLNERFRKQLRRKVLRRSWAAPGQPNEQFEIAQTVLAALSTLAPAVQRYSLAESKGRIDESSWATFLGRG